jgi:hypothetical protein
MLTDLPAERDGIAVRLAFSSEQARPDRGGQEHVAKHGHCNKAAGEQENKDMKEGAGEHRAPPEIIPAVIRRNVGRQVSTVE